MTPAELIIDALERVVADTRGAVDGLGEADLTSSPAPGANTIAWLVWHLARVQDSHVAQVAGTEQVWVAQGFVDRFALTLSPQDTGYGHVAAQVAEVRAPAELLTGYLEAVHEQSVAYLGRLTEEDLDVIVDRRWDPPVSLGVRLVSVVNDCTQHAGQAAYVRGLLGR